MPKTVNSPWDHETGEFADTVHETDKPEFSKLLVPDGKPLRYATNPVGFDLSRKQG